MNNVAPKLQKYWTHKIAFKIISKMLKQLNFFHSQPSTLPKFYLSTTFGLSFMIRSVAPTRSSTFCEYLITKIGNHNLESHDMDFSALRIFFHSNRKFYHHNHPEKSSLIKVQNIIRL